MAVIPIEYLSDKEMPRTTRPNGIYAPFRCFARVIRMLPYPPKEASERRVQSIGTRDGRHFLSQLLIAIGDRSSLLAFTKRSD